MTDLYRLVYSSKNLLHGTEREIAEAVAEILAASQRNNAWVGVTGALMFNAGAFAQVLEGPRRAVETTFERIQRDPRHGDVTVLQCSPIDTPGFPNWSMAFVGQSETGRALWQDMAAASGFDLSRLDGDGVFSMLHSLVLDEEGIPAVIADASPRRVGSDVVAGAFDAGRVKAELPRPGHALTAERNLAQPPSLPRSVEPPREPQPAPSLIEPQKPAMPLAIFRAALVDERLRTTELRNELDHVRVLLAETEARLAAVSGERDLWAERARALATAICEDVSAIRSERANGSAARTAEPAHARSAIQSVA